MINVLVRLLFYLRSADNNPRRITNAVKLFGDDLDFEEIKFLVKIKDIRKTKKKKNSLGASVFGYEVKEKYPIYVSKNALKKTYWSTTDRRRTQKTLCSYQRF